MKHADHVALLRDGVPSRGGVWADLGSGGGAFTLALAELLGQEGTIYSVDRDVRALREQERAMRARFPETDVRYVTADFARPLALPPLDGVVMANALHFHRDKVKIVRQVREWLRPGGRFILVEYNVDRGNIWVPHPLSYPTWVRLAQEAGFASTRLLATTPSSFLREFYAALSIAPAE